MKKLVDARDNLIDMHFIQYLKNEFCFDLPLLSKYLATSINSYFYKITLCELRFVCCSINSNNHQIVKKLENNTI